MQWITTPPCTWMDVKVSDVERGRVELAGPVLSSRVANGFAAAFGAFFASTALGFVRLPLPMPFRLIPLALTAVGTGISAVGASGATARHAIRAERGRGLFFDWKYGPLPAKSLHVPAKDIEAFEVTTHETSVPSRTSSSFSDSRTVVTHRLVVVTRDGKSLPIEEFGTRTQARLRKELIEAALAPRETPKPAPRETPKPTRRKASAPRRPRRAR